MMVWTNSKGDAAYVIHRGDRVEIGTMEGRFPYPFKTLEKAKKALTDNGFTQVETCLDIVGRKEVNNAR